ncbi:hypothetical protein [Actinomadura luteofluorescens]|uniref:hypothetical protein n=1 Tax=Actinomadura luteofluorescens TaxID=46163 RepID=UPI003D942147
MTWFKVDDRFHSHPKGMAASLAALGLWTVAGSWSSDHLTDGFIPDHVIASLSRGETELAKELCAAGLWKRSRGGYQFHEWDADSDGTVRNPTRDEALAGRRKMASGGAIGNHRRWHTGKGRVDAQCRYCQQEKNRGTPPPPDRVPDSQPESPPNPPSPVPSRPEGSVQVSESSTGPRRARENDDDPPTTRDQTIERLIVGTLEDLTGRTITTEHAAKVRRQLLDGRQVANPMAYVAKCLRERPNDYLPAETPADRPPPPRPLLDPERAQAGAAEARRLLAERRKADA